ncbi:hypothetical protein OSTOST_04058 [Ostertagia ostertagi]
MIRTLFSVPPLLIAKGAISGAIWDTWMRKEQLNDEGDPLLMDPEIIETAVADQLHTDLLSPDQLYKNIVARCHEFYECTKRISFLNSRVRNLHTSKADWKERFHELELLEIRCNLWSDLGYLDAKRTAERRRRSPSHGPRNHRNSCSGPTSHRLTLSDLRTALQNDDIVNATTFQESVTEKLRQIQSTLDEVIQQRNNVEMIDPQEPPPVGEGVPLEAQEQESIRENAENYDLEAEGEDAQLRHPPEPENQEQEDEQLRNPPEPEIQEREDARPENPPELENQEREDDLPRNAQ